MSTKIARALVTLLFGAAMTSPAAAQGSGATGSWRTEIARGLRNENGNVTAEGSVVMRLELKVEGEQVTGSWGPAEAPAGGAAVPRRAVKGTIKGNALSLTADTQQARVQINGELSVIELIPTFVLTLEGDALKGTYQLIPADGHEGMPPMPMTATRTAS